MEGGLPMLNCLLQHTLRSLCSDSSDSSKWVYAVFWRILPRNYPPPKWDFGGSALDRSNGNHRNWILVWEDGFCDFFECERAANGYIKGRFGADIFFKMSHEVYSYGEGLVGKIAAENSHKWVFRENQPEKDPNPNPSWNGSIDPQPKAWEIQFKTGIQTIAIVSVREGVIQLGSLEKIVEDLNLVINIQRKFNYLQSIPGVFTIQRPYLQPSQYPNTLKFNTQMTNLFHGEKIEETPRKSMNLGWNSPHIGGEGGVPFFSIPPLLPASSLEDLLSKLPSVFPSDSAIKDPNDIVQKDNFNFSNQSSNGGDLAQLTRIKTESCGSDKCEEENPNNPKLKTLI